MLLELSPPMVIPYSANVLANPNLWDRNFIAISLFGTNKFLQSDIRNMVCLSQCMACFLKQHSCYWRTMIVLSDHPRWMFKKNSMEFFVRLDYYLYYFTVAVLLLVHNHMFFQNVLWSPDLTMWSDYLSSYAIYISTPWGFGLGAQMHGKLFPFWGSHNNSLEGCNSNNIS